MSDLSLSEFPSTAVVLKDGHPVTSSLVVADVFGKQHKDVLKAIKNVECSDDFRRRNFAPTFRNVPGPNGAERQEPCIEMTRDGFTFLVMGFTGRQAAVFKESYIRAFNVLEAEAIKAASIQPDEYQNLRTLLLESMARERVLEQTCRRYHPRWVQLNRYVRLGLSDTEIARLLNCGRTTVRDDRRLLIGCGVLPTPPAKAPAPTTGDLFAAEVSHA